MKAFLLAGGRGERLRPFTLSFPKCLVPIAGEPLLGIWLNHCAREGIDRVLVNVSHHAERVHDFLAARAGPPSVHLVVEQEPHGTAGTVAANRWFVEGEESFWILYADNLTDASLHSVLLTHRRHDSPLTMCLFHAPDPTAAGIVHMAPDGRIVSFEEKPKTPRGDLANAGMYVARPELFAKLTRPPGHVLDFGFDVLPRLVGRMYGHVIDEFFMDVGTPAALAEASRCWTNRLARATT